MAALFSIAAIACRYDIGSDRSSSSTTGDAGPKGDAPASELQPGAGGTSAQTGTAGTSGGAPLAGAAALASGGSMGGSGGASSSAAGAPGGGAASMPDAGGAPASADTADAANVVSFSPPANATNVDTHAKITVSLDRAARAADAAFVSVESEAGASVPFDATVSGSTLTLTARAPLDMKTTFRVRLTSPLHGATSTWTFTTADGSLHPAEDLFYAGADPSETSRVIVASTAIRASTAIVAYRTVNKVVVRRSLHGSRTQGAAVADASTPGLAPMSWEADEPVSDAESDHLAATDTTAEIAAGIDAAGDVFLVWNAPAAGTGPYSIFASRYTAATGRWSSPPDRLERDTDTCAAAAASACGATHPRLAVGADGSALVVWERLAPVGGAVKSTVWAASFVSGSWSAAAVLSNLGGDEASVAMNGAGQGAAVWSEPGPSGYTAIQVRRFTGAKQSWDAPRSLVFAAQANAHTPFVAMNDRGTLLASFTEWPPGAAPQPGSGATRTYLETSTTTGTPSVGPAGQVNDDFRAALGAGDDVLAAWGAPDPNSVVAAARAPGGGDVWPVSVTIGATDEYVTHVVSEVDGSGRGLVVWLVGPDQAHPGVYSVRHDATLARPWSVPVSLSAPNAGALDVSMDTSGRALVVWILPDSGALQAVLFD